MANPIKNQIANLAIGHLGVLTEISDLETDRSPEAIICRRFFDISLEATLRDVFWPFASKFANLPLVAELTDDEWGYSYRYPSDCVNIRRIISGVRNDSQDSRTPFRLGQDASGLLILTDKYQARAEYTSKSLSANAYPPDFIMAVSLRLASYIAPKLTGGDPMKLGQRAMTFYEYEVKGAAASALNEVRQDVKRDSEFIEVRD